MSASNEGERVPHYIRSMQFDALYFRAACLSLKRAQDSLAGISAIDARLTSLLERERRAQAINDERTLESIAIQLVDGLDYEMCEAYEPFIEGVALTHVLASSCLEAHINVQAKAVLNNKQFESFDRLALKGKWLLMPLLIGKPSLDPSREPFQGFDELVTLRDKLVHAKPKAEEWQVGRPPAFLETFGITIGAAERSISTASGMLRELARVLGQEVPEWLSHKGPAVFGFDIKWRERKS